MKYFLTKFRGALITALVFFLLLGFILTRDNDKKEVPITESSYEFEIDGDVTAVEIYYPNSWVLLEREEEGDWFVLDDDTRFIADAKLVDRLIVDIKNADIAGSVPTEEVDLDQFGLENSRAELVVNTDDMDHRFIVGDNIPVGSGTYLYIPDENLVLVVEKNYLDSYLDLTSSDFRDKDLFTFDSGAVNRVSISSGTFTVNMFKEEGEWYVEQDEGVFVDNKKVDEILWIFSRAKVLGFEDEDSNDLAKFGLDDPIAEVRFYEDDRIEGLIFGKRKDEDSYYIKSDSDEAVYTIHKSLFKRIPKNLEQISSN